MTLSVAIIAKNEETSIIRCLDSVQGADEIIVVDTGSEDNTVNICKEHGATVYTDYLWEDDFSKARNHAKSKCKGDWILTLDADNRLVNGIPAVRNEIARAEAAGVKTISLKILLEDGGRFSHWLPYLYKNEPEISWKGAAHNYLTRDDKFYSELALSCWHSASHRGDRSRTFRILLKSVAENTELIREKFYLAREYFARGDYHSALHWYDQYMKKAYWDSEIAEAYLMMARCHWNLNQGDTARSYCMKAIAINTNFKEVIQFLAEISGPINKDRWLEFAEGADNSNVLFVREPKEWVKGDYDEHWKQDTDTSRYDEIYETIADIVKDTRVLDIGCGPARLARYIPHYQGFDLSQEGVRRANHPNVWVGSAYEKENFREASFYVATEVFEHLDDLKVIENIPSGKKVIFSVPSFPDESHVRIFTEKVVRRRYKDLFDIQKITQFNWTPERKWSKAAPWTRDYILLVEATKR